MAELEAAEETVGSVATEVSLAEAAVEEGWAVAAVGKVSAAEAAEAAAEAAAVSAAMAAVVWVAADSAAAAATGWAVAAAGEDSAASGAEEAAEAEAETGWAGEATGSAAAEAEEAATVARGSLCARGCRFRSSRAGRCRTSAQGGHGACLRLRGSSRRTQGRRLHPTGLSQMR